MKKVVFSVVLIIVSFIAGWEGFNWYYNVDDLYDCNSFRREVIHAYERQDSLIWNIIEDNNLLDTDGSDNMSDFLENSNKLDSLYMTQM